jgi:hypothetical protein
VKKHYHTEHAKNKSYSFKQALQDAAKSYKKGSVTETKCEKLPKNKRKTKKNKSRRSK